MQDVGKCRTDALIAEVLGAVDWIHWLEGNAKRVLAPEKVATPITLLGKKSMLLHEPLGVVLVICPWNYPFHNAITAIAARSEEHTSELQSLMRNSYAVICLTKKKDTNNQQPQ